ncbi:MAG: EAL domain-containing protein [Asticcacaulis sp.]|uniref:putative bifunctional diguanylate cyclase/phosphodiesterase n=1 Tax=Asticcacaulis sp. TaxID=1872648 RepID=UPI0039E36B1A
MTVFKRLSTRLAVMFGGLFALALLLIAFASYMAIVSYARASVQKELQASASVFNRIWTLKSDSLQTNAVLLSRDFGFRSALATHDNATVDSAFENLQTRLNIQTGLVIGADGQPLAGDRGNLGQNLAAALASRNEFNALNGIISVDSHPYQAVAAPVMAPDRLGWVVFAQQLDAGEMRSLQGLASIPIKASILTQTRGGLWLGPDELTGDYKPSSLSFFIDQSLQSKSASLINSSHGTMIAVATSLPNIDSQQRSVLLLSYPLSAALHAYQSLLTVLLAIGLFGLAAVVAASLYLARNLTRPILALKDAAFALRDGKPGLVRITTHDEMADLATAFNDMAVSIEERERDITRLAKTDIATDLPNRSAFEDHIAEAREAAHEKGNDKGIVIICIGIDRYAHIRAVWGVAYAHTLTGRLQDILIRLFSKAFIARLSADTLGLCLSPCDVDQALPLARAIIARLDKRIKVTDDQGLDVLVSLGVYHVANARLTPDEMIERALIALDQARVGKLKMALFDPRIYSELADTLLLTDQLHAALQNRAMQVWYQPKFSYRENRITAVEALVRWNHPERGYVSPQRFVQIAEETGAIRDLTTQVLQTCIADQGRLKSAGFDIDISINYSGRLLSDEAYNARALAICDEAVGQICLEITETAVIEDPTIGLAAINTFVGRGLEISIDDFGTGLSSLAYLKQIPAHELKIDRSFIMEIESGQRDALLVRSTIDLAHGLGMKVTAEGVETAAAFTLLQSMGCDIAQGYGIAKPMPFGDLILFMNDFNGMSAPKAKMPTYRNKKAV